jgi:hypothetical protein
MRRYKECQETEDELMVRLAALIRAYTCAPVVRAPIPIAVLDLNIELVLSVHVDFKGSGSHSKVGVVESGGQAGLRRSTSISRLSASINFYSNTCTLPFVYSRITGSGQPMFTLISLS